MPWKPGDAEGHTHKANTSHLKKMWSKIANSILENTGDEERAIRGANSKIARYHATHSTAIADVMCVGIETVKAAVSDECMVHHEAAIAKHGEHANDENLSPEARRAHDRAIIEHMNAKKCLEDCDRDTEHHLYTSARDTADHISECAHRISDGEKAEASTVTAHRLTYEERKNKPDSAFAVVKTVNGKKIRKYPIDDLSHARDALSRVAAWGTAKLKALIHRKVHARWPSIGEHAHASTDPIQTHIHAFDEYSEVCMDVEVLLRLLEWARVSADDDDDLHTACEHIMEVYHQQGSPLGMENVDQIIDEDAGDEDE
jgi:hypothetical protein